MCYNVIVKKNKKPRCSLWSQKIIPPRFAVLGGLFLAFLPMEWCSAYRLRLLFPSSHLRISSASKLPSTDVIIAQITFIMVTSLRLSSGVRTRHLYYTTKYSACQFLAKQNIPPFSRGDLLCLEIICVGLAEQLQNGLRLSVRLSEHGLSSLLENVELGVVHHLGSHIGVADSGLCFLQVLTGSSQVSDLVLETVLSSVITENSTKLKR